MFGRFRAQDAFVGYQVDTPASVIFQATQQLCQEQGRKLPDEINVCNEWKDAVLWRSQFLLLQMATPDALLRLKRTALAKSAEELTQMYFTKQKHISITDFLCHHLKDASKHDCGSLFQVCHKLTLYVLMHIYIYIHIYMYI